MSYAYNTCQLQVNCGRRSSAVAVSAEPIVEVSSGSERSWLRFVLSPWGRARHGPRAGSGCGAKALHGSSRSSVTCLASFATGLGCEAPVLGEAPLFIGHALPALARDLPLPLRIHRCKSAMRCVWSFLAHDESP